MIGLSILALAASLDDPCALLSRADIKRAFGWSVGAGVRKEFHLPAAGADGSLCTYEGESGSVVVTIGHAGRGLPNNDATNGLAPVRSADQVRGLGLPTDIGPSQVVVHYRGHDYGISVQFADANFADDATLRQLARAMIRRLKPPAAVRTHALSPLSHSVPPLLRIEC
jgi:hypothetical protein